MTLCFINFLGIFQEVKQYAKVEEVSDETLFSEVYHNLIHSPALDTLLNLEHTYALTIEDLIDQRDKDLQHLEERYKKVFVEHICPHHRGPDRPEG